MVDALKWDELTLEQTEAAAQALIHTHRLVVDAIEAVATGQAVGQGALIEGMSNAAQIVGVEAGRGLTALKVHRGVA